VSTNELHDHAKWRPDPLETGSGTGQVDTPFLTVVNTAEAVYNKPSSTRAQLLAQQRILERVNLRDE